VNSSIENHTGTGASFDLFRLSKSKDVVDVCPNTLRAYFKLGLPFYQRGKAIFISKTELAHFIRQPVRARSLPMGAGMP
jgi:hypothetical protein